MYEMLINTQHTVNKVIIQAYYYIKFNFFMHTFLAKKLICIVNSFQ